MSFHARKSGFKHKWWKCCALVLNFSVDVWKQFRLAHLLQCTELQDILKIGAHIYMKTSVACFRLSFIYWWTYWNLTNNHLCRFGGGGVPLTNNYIYTHTESLNLMVARSPLATENDYGWLKTHSKVACLATDLKKINKNIIIVFSRKYYLGIWK